MQTQLNSGILFTYPYLLKPENSVTNPFPISFLWVAWCCWLGDRTWLWPSQVELLQHVTKFHFWSTWP